MFCCKPWLVDFTILFSLVLPYWWCSLLFHMLNFRLILWYYTVFFKSKQGTFLSPRYAILRNVYLRFKFTNYKFDLIILRCRKYEIPENISIPTQYALYELFFMIKTIYNTYQSKDTLYTKFLICHHHFKMFSLCFISLINNI